MFSDEIEEQLVMQIKNNNISAFSKLCLKYDNLFNKLSWDFTKRYPYLPLEFDDFYNYSIYLFYKLILEYKIDSKKPFPIYIKTFLKFNISNYVKKFQTKNNVFNNKLFPIPEDNYAFLEPSNDYLMEEVEEIIQKIVFLTNSEKTILIKLLDDQKPANIASSLNKNTTSIYASLSRIRKKINNNPYFILNI